MNLRELLHSIVFQPAYAAAIEIEDSIIRIGHATPRTHNMTLIHEHPLEPGAVEHGEVVNERELMMGVGDAIRASGLRATYYVTHAPARHTALRLLQFPPMPARELRDAVRYEAARNLPYSLADAAIGFAPIEDVITPKSSKQSKSATQPRRSLLTRRKGSGPSNEPAGEPPTQPDASAPATSEQGTAPNAKSGGESTQQLVAATPNAHVLTLMRVARQVGFRLGVVEPKALATLRALQRHQLMNPNDLILDIHTHHAHINAVTEGSLKLNRLLAYQRRELSHGSSDDITESLTRDITSTLEYLSRIDDTVLMRRLLVAGGTLSEPLTRIITDLGLEIHHATIPNAPPEHTAIIGLALRGAGGI